MGFRRRKENVSRTSPSPSLPTSNRQRHQGDYLPPSLLLPRRRSLDNRLTTKPAITAPDPDGPRIIYTTLLDSGATLPCIYETDLPALKISPSHYAAQSARTISTADRVTRMRVYELDVSVYAPDGSTLIRAHDTNVQIEGRTETSTLGATIPCVALPGKAAGDYDAAENAPDRLSGLLPFHVCYVSSAPGNFKMWFGEGRRDVLGAGRFPGGLGPGGWWDREGDRVRLEMEGDRDGEEWEGEGLKEVRSPGRVIFQHVAVGADGRARVVVDEDTVNGMAVFNAPGGTTIENLDPNADDVDIVRMVELKGKVTVRRSVRKRRKAN
jgi:hypothetical protein